MPTTEAHSVHICGTSANFSQRVHPIIVQKISEFVAGGITETLRSYTRILIHGANKDTIEEHIHCESTEGTWATQVDVVATATVYTGQYVWNVIKPLKCKTQEITLPA